MRQFVDLMANGPTLDKGLQGANGESLGKVPYPISQLGELQYRWGSGKTNVRFDHFMIDQKESRYLEAVDLTS